MHNNLVLMRSMHGTHTGRHEYGKKRRCRRLLAGMPSAKTSCDEGQDNRRDIWPGLRCAHKCENGAAAVLTSTPSEGWTWVLC